MELGNMLFGNSRGTYAVEREDAMWAQLKRLADALECDTYFSPGFENDVFAVRPYCWGDCDCGYEDKEWEWSANHKHSNECYQTDYNKLPDYGYDTHGRACREIDARKLHKKHGIPWRGMRGIATHCTCGHDKSWRKWSTENHHSVTCCTVLPNFHFKPTGFKLRWYKYPLRDSYSNVKCNLSLLRGMVHECIRSLGKDPLDF